MVLDKRAKRLARVIIDHSVNIQPDDRLLVKAEDVHEGFIEHLATLAKERGAEVVVDYFNLEQRKQMIERHDLAELKAESSRLCRLAEWCTAAVQVVSLSDPVYLLTTDPQKTAAYYELIVDPVNERLIGDGKEFPGVKWNLTELPCAGQAVLADMDMEKYAKFLYRATNQDWYLEGQRMKKIKELFDKASEVRIEVPHLTKLTLSLEGRGGCIEDGRINMPGGEVLYGPVEDSAEGVVTFPYPIVRSGTVINGLRLEFRKGKIVNATATENQEFVRSMIEIPGADRLGEFAVGTNHRISRYVRNLSFDEKMGGTMHIALGKSYPYLLSDGGGLNQSKLHWDIVCDLRKTRSNPGGKIFLDGELVQENGKWCFDYLQREKRYVPEEQNENRLKYLKSDS